MAGIGGIAGTGEAGLGGTVDVGGMAGNAASSADGGTSGNGGTDGGGSAGDGGTSNGGIAGTGTSGDGGTSGTGTSGTGGAGNGGTSGTGTSGTGGKAGAGGSAGTASGGTNSQGGASGSAGSGGGSGDPSPKSSLPAPSTTGVPRPSGTAGNLRVLNWAGFKGAVSYTFDDSNSSQIQNYSTLQSAGVHYTFYLQTGKTADSSNNVWRTALTNGHELGNHTRNHSSNDDGSDTDAATQFIESTFGITVYTMAAPNGSSVYTNIARTRFLANRGVSNALVQPNDNTDPFTLPCYLPPQGASASTMNQQVDTAESSGGWRIFLVHGFTGGSDGAYQPVALSEFMSTVSHSKTKNLWIDSLLNVVAYWRAQKTLTSTTPTSSGGTTTYNWTLPDHFPPGMFLRVTVDGGTLKQGDTTLTWDDHGYYEVALDRRTLAISP